MDSRIKILCFAVFGFGFAVWSSFGALCDEEKRGFLNNAPYYYYYTEYVYCSTDCCGYYSSRFCCEGTTQTPAEAEGLATGVIVGIAVGCTVGLIIIVIIIVIVAKICCPTKVKVLHTDEKTRLAIIGAEHRFHMRTQLSKTSGETDKSMDVSSYSNFYMHPYFAKGALQNQSLGVPSANDNSVARTTLMTAKLGDNNEVGANETDNVPFWRNPGANPFLLSKNSPWGTLKPNTLQENAKNDGNDDDKNKVINSSTFLKPNKTSMIPSAPPLTTVTPLNSVKPDDTDSDDGEDLLMKALRLDQSSNTEPTVKEAEPTFPPIAVIQSKSSKETASIFPPVTAVQTKSPSSKNLEDESKDDLLSQINDQELTLAPVALSQNTGSRLTSVEGDDENDLFSTKKSKTKKKRKRNKVLDASNDSFDTKDPYPVLAPLAAPKNKASAPKIPEDDSDDDLYSGFTASDIFAPKDTKSQGVQPFATSLDTSSNLNDDTGGLNESKLPPLPSFGKPSASKELQKTSYNDFGDSDTDSLFNGLL